MLILIDSGMITVFVAFIVVLFGNWTVGPSRVSVMLVTTKMYSVCQELFDVPLSDFAMIVAC